MLNKNQRELIIRLWEQRKKQQEIAALLGCSQPTVHFWIQRYRNGLTLKSLPRSGRPTPLTKKTLAKLKAEFTKEAHEANKNFCSIDVKKFAIMLEQVTNKKYSTRHVERVLHRLDFSRITPRSQHLLNDPKKVQKFRDEFKKNSNRSTWVMSL